MIFSFTVEIQMEVVSARDLSVVLKEKQLVDDSFLVGKIDFLWLF